MPLPETKQAQKNLRKMVECAQYLTISDIPHWHGFIIGYCCAAMPEDDWYKAMHYATNMLQVLRTRDDNAKVERAAEPKRD